MRGLQRYHRFFSPVGCESLQVFKKLFVLKPHRWFEFCTILFSSIRCLHKMSSGNFCSLPRNSGKHGIPCHGIPGKRNSGEFFTEFRIHGIPFRGIPYRWNSISHGIPRNFAEHGIPRNFSRNYADFIPPEKCLGILRNFYGIPSKYNSAGIVFDGIMDTRETTVQVLKQIFQLKYIRQESSMQ